MFVGYPLAGLFGGGSSLQPCGEECRQESAPVIDMGRGAFMFAQRPHEWAVLFVRRMLGQRGVWPLRRLRCFADCAERRSSWRFAARGLSPHNASRSLYFLVASSRERITMGPRARPAAIRLQSGTSPLSECRVATLPAGHRPRNEVPCTSAIPRARSHSS
jgi:hypothetical protein